MYEIKVKYDSKGKEHIHCYVPSIRGMAWIELELPKDEEFRQMILDESFLPEWKKEWLRGEYERFILKERKRKNEFQTDKSELLSFDDYEEAPSDLLPPDLKLIRAIEEEEKRERLMRGLRKLNDKERRYVYLRFVNELSFKEIAALEVDEELITKRAGAIQKMVSRALKKMRDV